MVTNEGYAGIPQLPLIMQFENTYRLEGLIQGPLPPGPDGLSVIKKLTADFNRNGLRLSACFDDSQFKLTAENVTAAPRSTTSASVCPMPHAPGGSTTVRSSSSEASAASGSSASGVR